MADPEGIKEVRSNTPIPAIFKFLYVWKWNKLVSVRPTYFIFIGIFKKNEIKSAKWTPHFGYIHVNPHSRDPESAPAFLGTGLF